MSGGGFHTRWNHPEADRIYPTPEWAAGQIRTGGHVYRRRIIVIEEWTEIKKRDLGREFRDWRGE
jgi:hypothetical protein